MLRVLFRPSLLRQPGITFSRFSRSSSSQKVSDPLRVLFCGSDEFSCASLQALRDEHVRNPSLIRSIDVVVRPGKPTGRGYKAIREVPLRKLAQQLSLAIHERDTFTGWQMPEPRGEPINLIVAVSFGLFVPPRLLNAAKYGGLNVHPSLLPNLRGPAPLHHALLSRLTHTGISLQTLSPLAFDAGVVLSQTPRPGISIPADATVPQLSGLLAPLGAAMLVRGLRDGVHVPPPHVGVDVHSDQEGQLRHAPKVTPRDRCVDWAAPGWGAAEFALRARVVGPLWSRALRRTGGERRVLFEGVEDVGAGPEAVAEFVRRAERRRARQLDGSSGGEARGGGAAAEAQVAEADSEDGDGGEDVRTVTWLQDLPGGEGESSTRQFRIPYFVDGDAILVPAVGGGCVRIAAIKVEGERTKPAATAIQAFSEERGHRGNFGIADFATEVLALPFEMALLRNPWML